MEACGKYVETGEPIIYNGREVRAKARELEQICNDREEFWQVWKKQQGDKKAAQNEQSDPKL